MARNRWHARSSPGACADLLIVESNPLEDIPVIGGADPWFDAAPDWRRIEAIRVVVLSGAIPKNTRQST